MASTGNLFGDLLQGLADLIFSPFRPNPPPEEPKKKEPVWHRTRKGRVVYDRKKHMFTWQRCSKICFDLINLDIEYHLRERYYARMRAGFLGYGYAMLRMYPELAESYIGGLAKLLAERSKSTGVKDAWKDITFKIIDLGLAALGPDIEGIDVVKQFARWLGEAYYDLLFKLVD